MRDIIGQIRAASEAGHYYVALLGALVLPDTCAALATDDGRATGARYAAWFDENVAGPRHWFLDGAASYQFRCALMHRTSARIANDAFERVFFLEPQSRRGLFIDNSIVNGALSIDVNIFVEAVCEAAEAWLGANETAPAVARNLERVVRRHSEGLLPYVEGVPVIG